MVQLNFELPSALATTLQNEAQNDQNRVGEIVDFALLKHLDMDPSNEEIRPAARLGLAAPLVAKMNAIAVKADVDLDAIVKVAIQQYFSQSRTAADTLPSILQRLTGIRPKASNV